MSWVWGEAAARTLTIPDGVSLIDGETLSIVDENGEVEITFVQSSTAGPAGTVSFQPTDTGDAIAARVVNALSPLTETTVNGAEITIYGAFSLRTFDPSTAITQAIVDAVEVRVPRGSELIDGETLDIVDNVTSTVTTITFRQGTTAGPGEVNFEFIESSDVIADRLAIALASLGAVVNAPVGFNHTGVRILGQSATYSRHLPGPIVTDEVSLGSRLLLPLTDVSRLRTGLQIGFTGFGGFEQIVFIESGAPFDHSQLGFGVTPDLL